MKHNIKQINRFHKRLHNAMVVYFVMLAFIAILAIGMLGHIVMEYVLPTAMGVEW